MFGPHRDRGAGRGRGPWPGRGSDRAGRYPREPRAAHPCRRTFIIPKGVERVREAMSEALDQVRAAALELPETEERLSHGQPTFFVAGKQFAQFRDNHHGDGKTVVCVRVSSLDEQGMLLEADPQTYSKPAYMPSWLAINLAGES